MIEENKHLSVSWDDVLEAAPHVGVTSSAPKLTSCCLEP